MADAPLLRELFAYFVTDDVVDCENVRTSVRGQPVEMSIVIAINTAKSAIFFIAAILPCSAFRTYFASECAGFSARLRSIITRGHPVDIAPVTAIKIASKINFFIRFSAL